MTKLRQKSKRIIFLSLIAFSLSCSDQDKLFDGYKRDFNNQIIRDDAHKFEYQHWKVEDYEYYFKDCKLKYLIVRQSGEAIDTESLIYFEGDSVSKSYMRIEYYKSPDRWDKISDSIHVKDFKNKTVSKYSNGKLIQKRYHEIMDWSLWLHNLKKKTEQKYKCA